jgi:hypothetical protein
VRGPARVALLERQRAHPVTASLHGAGHGLLDLAVQRHDDVRADLGAVALQHALAELGVGVDGAHLAAHEQTAKHAQQTAPDRPLREAPADEGASVGQRDLPALAVV